MPSTSHTLPVVAGIAIGLAAAWAAVAWTAFRSGGWEVEL